MEVTFKFTLNQSVFTPFGQSAMVSTCAVDRSGVVYYVKHSSGGDWFHEDQLTASA